jgi:hypothetical protein
VVQFGTYSFSCSFHGNRFRNIMLQQPLYNKIDQYGKPPFIQMQTPGENRKTCIHRGYFLSSFGSHCCCYAAAAAMGEDYGCLNRHLLGRVHWRMRRNHNVTEYDAKHVIFFHCSQTAFGAKYQLHIDISHLHPV